MLEASVYEFADTQTMLETAKSCSGRKERADLDNLIGYRELLLDFDQVAPQR
jgi:hypothetical protein